MKGRSGLIASKPGNSVNVPAESVKREFDIHETVRRIREAVQPFAKAALFELAEQGFDSVFEQLVACIISIRTLDEVTVPTAQELFRMARTPAEVSRLPVYKIDELIRRCTFHEAKARSICQIAHDAVEKHGGVLPCDSATLLALPGVGPKCTNLVLARIFHSSV